jgi:xanthine/uracil/vitamin C permease (AzgA family)
LDAVFVFFVLALFDSVGTLVGVAGRMGFVRRQTRPRAPPSWRRDRHRRWSCLGTSTVTAYVESASGVAAGGRTGLASVVTACAFLAALFFSPLVKMIGGGYPSASGVVLYPIIAPALILVGVMMMEGVRHIRWDDFTEAMPAFLAMMTMALAFSITDGIAFGFIAFAILKPATGRARELAARLRVRRAVRPALCLSVTDKESLVSADSELLISPDRLNAELAGHPPPLVIDGRPAEQFARGQIPGAVHLDVWGISLIDTSDAPLRLCG